MNIPKTIKSTLEQMFSLVNEGCEMHYP